MGQLQAAMFQTLQGQRAEWGAAEHLPLPGADSVQLRDASGLALLALVRLAAGIQSPAGRSDPWQNQTPLAQR